MSERAKYTVGDQLYFQPSPNRAPHGSIIAEGMVTVVRVIDHITATPYAPRFSYVVQSLVTGEMQGTDDSELSTTAPTPAVIEQPTVNRTIHVEVRTVEWVIAFDCDSPNMAAFIVAMMRKGSRMAWHVREISTPVAGWISVFNKALDNWMRL